MKTNDKKFLRNTIAPDLSEEEFEFFEEFCKRRRLDPLSRHVWPVKRWNKNLRKNILTIQTGIDGYRLIAKRTEKIAPGKGVEFKYKEDGSLFSAEFFIKTITNDGIWHETSAIALFDEYVQRDKLGSPTAFWKTKGHIMLSKCAESLVLRREFPEELSGLYTQEEMSQDKNDQDPNDQDLYDQDPHDSFPPINMPDSYPYIETPPEIKPPEKISLETLQIISKFCKDKPKILNNILSKYNIQKLSQIPYPVGENLKERIKIRECQ